MNINELPLKENWLRVSVKESEIYWTRDGQPTQPDRTSLTVTG